MQVSLLTTTQIRELVETDLSDTALQMLIDDAEAEIVERYGAHAEDGAVTEQHVVNSGERWIFPRRKLDASEDVVVTRQVLGGVDVTTAGEDEYTTDSNGSVRLLASESWIGTLVTITYTPLTDAPRRRRVLADLVRLAIRYDAASSTSMGDMQVSHVGYEQERDALLRRLSRMSGSIA